MAITEEAAKQVGTMAQQGASVIEIANSWGVKPTTLYKALKRYGVNYTRNALSPTDHLDMQAESGTPPEVYAARANLTLNTMRRYAWENERRLAMNTFAERKAYWLRKLDEFDPTKVKAFAAMHLVPVPMLAHWYHRLNGPSQLLLWGFNNLLVLDGDQFRDFPRYADPKADLYAIGQGKNCAPVSAIIASEAFRFARPYQHH